MATENIEGTVTDSKGNPLQDAVIALFLTNKNASDGDMNGVKYTRTDSNGNFVIKDHPDADGSSQEWHVAGYYEDGTGEFNALSKPSVKASVGLAIHDTSMFQSPLYQFWAGDINANDGDSPVSYPEILAGLSDATANGDPTFDASLNGKPAVDYDGLDDSHNWSPDSNMPSGSDNYSVACLFYLASGNQSGKHVIFGWGDSNGANYFGTDDSALEVYQPGTSNSAGGTLNDGYNTGGFSYNGSAVDVYLNGTEVATGTSANSSISNNNHSIGYRGRLSDLFFDGSLVEAIVTTADESETAYSDYHTNRLG